MTLNEVELEAIIERVMRRVVVIAPPPDVMSIDDAARYAKRDPKTIRRWIKSGELVAGKRDRMWAIKKVDLDEFLAGTRPRGKTLVEVLSTIDGRTR